MKRRRGGIKKEEGMVREDLDWLRKGIYEVHILLNLSSHAMGEGGSKEAAFRNQCRTQGRARIWESEKEGEGKTETLIAKHTHQRVLEKKGNVFYFLDVVAGKIRRLLLERKMQNV